MESMRNPHNSIYDILNDPRPSSASRVKSRRVAHRICRLIVDIVEPSYRCGTKIRTGGRRGRRKNGTVGEKTVGEKKKGGPRGHKMVERSRCDKWLTRQKWHGGSLGEERARVKPSQEKGAMVKSLGFLARRAPPAVHLFVVLLALAPAYHGVDLCK
ncbi:hypothetical protein G5I_04899 [Acromyrmex echinatior]|uniref:Uncharacterized protein n=1 Tax=Acromyrmex echinatior TaxID=103372 RepID=F4WGU8_ACREC|nr:hypothetical protein G5I_04899 [Acromyrmex echinatior]